MNLGLKLLSHMLGVNLTHFTGSQMLWRLIRFLAPWQAAGVILWFLIDTWYLGISPQQFAMSSTFGTVWSVLNTVVTSALVVRAVQGAGGSR